DQSISYLTHPDLGAWFAARNAYWRYPDFYDKADYLVFQKNVQAIVSVDTHIALYAEDRLVDTHEIIGKVYNDLVVTKRLYSVYQENGNVLVLKRNDRAPNEIPRRLVGFNFLFR